MVLLKALETRKKFLEKAKLQTQEALSQKDALIIQAVRSIDDLDEVKSLLQQRLNEWFKVNFPDLRVNDDVLAKIAAEFGSKEHFQEKGIAEIASESKANAIMVAAGASYGAKFDKDDSNAVKVFAKQIAGIMEARKETEEYVKAMVEKEMKNVAYLVDPLLAARLLALAGSLKNLAEMPASTIQVIGAERSLFKHLRQHTRPPKHGIIFQHPAINSAPMHQRGRIARALAAKLAIAAKADFYTHHFIAEKLKEQFEKRLKQIQDAPIKPQSEKPKNNYREGSREDDFRRGRPFGERRFGGGGGRPFGNKPFNRPSGGGGRPFDRNKGGSHGGSGGQSGKPFGNKPFHGGGGKPFGKKPFKRFDKGRR